MRPIFSTFFSFSARQLATPCSIGITSILGISRYKDLNQVNEQAEKVSAEEGIPYDFTNWRKGRLQEKTNELAKQLNLYRQDYCGCTPRK